VRKGIVLEPWANACFVASSWAMTGVAFPAPAPTRSGRVV